MSDWEAVRQQNKVDALMLADERGFVYHNHNFESTLQLHHLSLLNHYFFPDAPRQTVIGIEGTHTTTIIRTNNEDGSLTAIRQNKG